MHEGNFFELGGSINYSMTNNWLEFGFHSSKGEVTTGPNMSLHSNIPGSNFVNGEDVLEQY